MWPGAFHLVSILKNRRRDVSIGSRIALSAYSTLITVWGKIALTPLLSLRIHTCYSEGVLRAKSAARLTQNGIIKWRALPVIVIEEPLRATPFLNEVPGFVGGEAEGSQSPRKKG